jgi:hypothetical protein
MTAILYGNLRVEIISDIGARVQRVGLTRPATGPFRPRQAEAETA